MKDHNLDLSGLLCRYSIGTPALVEYAIPSKSTSAWTSSSLLKLLLDLQAWLIAGLFVLLAVPVTVYEVAMHLEYFSRPRLQIYVIRILWMVPIYAVDAWLALRFKVQHFSKLNKLSRKEQFSTGRTEFQNHKCSI